MINTNKKPQFKNQKKKKPTKVPCVMQQWADGMAEPVQETEMESHLC